MDALLSTLDALLSTPAATSRGYDILWFRSESGNAIKGYVSLVACLLYQSLGAHGGRIPCDTLNMLVLAKQLPRGNVARVVESSFV